MMNPLAISAPATAAVALAIFLAGAAQAAPTATVAPVADAKVELQSFQAGIEYPAEVVLLKFDGRKTGRENPIYNGYRPQLSFAGAKATVSCKLRIPSSPEKVEPGETAAVGIGCLEDFKAPRND